MFYSPPSIPYNSFGSTRKPLKNFLAGLNSFLIFSPTIVFTMDDPKYIDKNHADALIIWDRMVGSFQKEEEKHTYGITLKPEWCNFIY
jgi:hypothetical protein